MGKKWKNRIKNQGQQQVQDQTQQVVEQAEKVVKDSGQHVARGGGSKQLADSKFEKFIKKAKGSKIVKDPKGRIKELWKNNPKTAKWTAGVGGALAGTLAVSGGVRAYKHYKDKERENEIRNQVNGRNK